MAYKHLILAFFFVAAVASTPLADEKFGAKNFIEVETPVILDDGEVIELTNPVEDEVKAAVEPFVDETKQLIVGGRQVNDKLVEIRNVEVEFKRFRVVTKEELFAVSSNEIITQIVAVNKKTDGTGANVVVNSGATNTSSIQLRFKSQRGHGIHFTVYVYAKVRY